MNKLVACGFVLQTHSVSADLEYFQHIFTAVCTTVTTITKMAVELGFALCLKYNLLAKLDYQGLSKMALG